MIGDISIDLTEDNKFGRPRFDLNEIPVVQRFDLSLFPWNTRRVERQVQLEDTRLRRLYGDSISDDMGFLVRRTSDNKWFFGDYTDLKKSWFWNCFYELLYECCLYKEVDAKCIRCGRHLISSKHIDRECPYCNIEMEADQTYKKLFNKPVVENYIPWRDFSTTVKLDDFGNWIPTIVESKTYLESVRR